MFFDSWESLFRIIIVGVLAYASLVLLLRTSGKRTLTKLNAFDLVITVALGSTLATILLSKQTPLADGVTALALLIFLQFVITSLSVRSGAVRSLVRSEPRVLFLRGEFLRDAMKDERVSEDEVLQAMRSGGYTDPDGAGAVVLETDGSLSILPRTSSPATVLAGVNGRVPAD
jgi:uncharacterized membrane protein YcaP (DUF421 family)